MQRVKLSTTTIEQFPFDPTSENQVHVVLNDSGATDYTADQIQFTSEGVTVVRLGTDVNFFPWGYVAKVYQEM